MTKQQFAHCRLEVEFGTTPTQSLSMILYAQFPGGIRVDKVRNVSLK